MLENTAAMSASAHTGTGRDSFTKIQLADELQGADGLIAHVRKNYLLDGKHMSAMAYKNYICGNGPVSRDEIIKNADSILEGLLRTELECYQSRTDALLSEIIPFYIDNIMDTSQDKYPVVRQMVREAVDSCAGETDGFAKVGQMTKIFAPAMDIISFSIRQSSKSRAGNAFENHLQILMDICRIQYRQQYRESDGRTYIDFVVPYGKEKGIKNIASIECQTTLKDRFRLSAGKAVTTDKKCFLATPTGVGIFTKKDTNDMTVQKAYEIIIENGMVLVAFPAVKNRLISLIEKNIKKINSSKKAGAGFMESMEKCIMLKNSVNTGIISFSELFSGIMS